MCSRAEKPVENESVKSAEATGIAGLRKVNHMALYSR
jgi:hypothetical protein